jgi:hypothetical protein
MRIGEYNQLTAVRESEHGLYFADREMDVLLPRGQCPEGLPLGETMRLFVYTDSEDRPIATTKRPIAVVGEFAATHVVTVTQAGAFLDWGLDKDLFCPVREQASPMVDGGDYVVRVYLDEVSRRVVCSSKLSRFLKDGSGLTPGQKVQVMVAGFRDEAIDLIVNETIKGTLFPDEWHERLLLGEIRDAYVKKVDEQGRVALSLRPVGYEAVVAESGRLVDALRAAGGFLPVTDKSSPEELQRRFGLSKGAFKKMVGTLYREGRIELEAHGIRLRERN